MSPETISIENRRTDIPCQLAGDTTRIPSTGMLQPVPTGSGDLLRPPTPPQTEPDRFRLFCTRADLVHSDDAFLNYNMMLRYLPFGECTTQEEQIRQILQHREPPLQISLPISP